MLNSFRAAQLIPRPHCSHPRGRLFALIALTALLLLWPAYINGGPFWFPDTSTYVRSADAATVVLTGSPSEWSNRLKVGDDGPVASSANPVVVSEQRAQLKPTRPVLAGRSIYYGFVIYLPMRFLGPWGAVVAQALITASILCYCVGVALRDRATPPFVALATAGVLLFLTPLPFYTSMLMPDVYSGLIILTLGTLIASWEKLATAERLILLAISGVMASFHSTNLLLALSIGTFGAIPYLQRRLGWRPLLIATPVFAIGLLSGTVFSMAIAHSLHEQPIRPPFLSARMIAAGPGTEYLQKTCAKDSEAWGLCPYVKKLPLESDSFLWSEDSKTGVFQLASAERQRRLSREDMPFFLAVVRQNPWNVIRVSLISTWKELTSFDLMNFNYPAEKVDELSTKYPPRIAQSIAWSRAARHSMPTSLAVAASIATTLLSLTILAVFWLRRRQLRVGVNDFNLPLLLLLGVLANAAICGALSGPHARYQMRLIWLLPLAASVVVSVAARPASKRSITDEGSGQ